MKKLFSLLLAIFVSFSLYAQGSQDARGPEVSLAPGQTTASGAAPKGCNCTAPDDTKRDTTPPARKDQLLPADLVPNGTGTQI